MEYRLYPHSVDSHMHIMEMKKKGMDVDAILTKAFQNGLEMAMDASVDENDFDQRIAFGTKYPQILFSSGIHPSSVKDLSSQIPVIETQLGSGKVSAVGETGLDFHWDTVPAERQKEMFAAHIALSKKYRLPLIVHNRLADKEILELLISENAEQGVIHCFSSNFHFARKFVDRGFYISFAGNITYKKSDEIREAASRIPLDRILVETDAPYLSPQKMRGKLNHSGYIGYTIDCIADIFNKGADETAYQTCQNFKTLFRAEKNAE